MNISQKLILSFLLVASLASVASFFTLRSYQDIHVTFARAMNDSTRTLDILNDIKHSGERIISSTSEIGFIHDEAEDASTNALEEEETKLAKSGYRDFEANLDRYRTFVQTVGPEDANTLEVLRASGYEMIETSKDIIELKGRNQRGIHVLAKKNEFEMEEATFLKYVDDALQKESAEQIDEQARVEESITVATEQTLIVTVSTFILAIFSGFYISFLISRRIGKLKEASRRVGEGDLEVTIEIDSSDEVGDLSHAFNNMIGDLRVSRDEILSAKSFTDDVIASISNVLFVLEMDLTIARVNQSAIDACQFPASELIGQSIKILRPDNGLLSERDVQELFTTGALNSMETFLRRKDGEEVPVLFSAAILRNLAGIGYGIVCVAQDITERKSLENQLTHQALHDPLTRLANRLLFRDRVEHAIDRIRRHPAPVAVLFLDLDNFKSVNDSMGHGAGDDLLVSVTDRLRTCLRASDTPARLGGDEFAVLIEDIEHEDEAAIIAERIGVVLRAPFSIGGTDIFISSSIGIAITTAGSEKPEELLRNADMAMYISKANGKDRYTIFKNEMHDALIKRIRLESDMRSAIEKQEFEIYYQPIIDLHTEVIMGMEALVRWNHPEHGLIPPVDFIPLADETGLIVPLGKWILNEACRQARCWQNIHKSAESLSITVNIASRQFQEESLLETVRQALFDSGLPPHSLVLEITESTMLQNTETTIRKLTELKELGIRFAIDDFGTGYSSLSYLQRFPVDILKIDKSFIDKIAVSNEGAAVAKAIITMSGTLRLKTIAEGIESNGQHAELQKLGCELGQGFHFAKALRTSEMSKFLEQSFTRNNKAIPPNSQVLTDNTTGKSFTTV